MFSQITSLAIPDNRLGVSVSGNGFVKNGRPFSGIGVNHWGAFINEVSSLGIPSNYRTDLPTIKNTYGLPFIRVSVGMYSRPTWYNNWYLTQSTYLAKLDDFVAKCESVGLGCIVTLAWNLRAFTDMCFDVYGAHSPPKDLAYKHTKAWQLFSQYVTQIVNRYKNSPAVYGWEICNEPNFSVGNEYNYGWKLDGTDVVAAAFSNWGNSPIGSSYAPCDKFTQAEWRNFSAAVIALINSIDPHQRMISSGVGLGSQFAVGAQSTNTVAADTLAQWSGVASTEGIPYVAYRDKPYNTICAHIYPQSAANSRFFLDGQKTQAEMIQLCKQWADASNKPFYLGEWGACYLDPADETSVDVSTETANFNAALSSITTNGVKMSSIWNYDGDLAGGFAWMKWKLTDPTRLYQLTAIANANASMSN